MDNRTIRLSDAIEAIGKIPVDHKGCPRDLALDKAIEALSALPPVEGWLDIDTFAEPTSLSSGDGVLIACINGDVGEAYYRNFGDDSDGWWWSNTSWGDYPEPDRPTPVKWQPLPAPPIE